MVKTLGGGAFKVHQDLVMLFRNTKRAFSRHLFLSREKEHWAFIISTVVLYASFEAFEGYRGRWLSSFGIIRNYRASFENFNYP